MSVKYYGDSNVVRVQTEIYDEFDSERKKRNLRELKRAESAEAALNNLSIFSYSPVDFTSGLVRKQYIAPEIPDYNYLLTEARLRAVNRYYVPIFSDSLLGLVCVLFSLAFMDTFVPLLGAAGLIACAVMLNKDLLKRQQAIENALSTARVVIDARVKEAHEKIETERKVLELSEDARIEKLEKLLSGSADIVFERIEETIHFMKLPFFLKCTIDFYGNEPMITLHLPDHDIIPPNIVTLTAAGNVSYEEKSSFQVNKQYSEVIAGTAITLAVQLYANIPTLNKLCIQGLFDRWHDEEYYFSLNITRQCLIDSTECRSGLEAFRMLDAVYEVKTSGRFSEIQPVYPDWWEKVPIEKIRTLNVSCQLNG
jgi:hypothetical protein